MHEERKSGFPLVMRAALVSFPNGGTLCGRHQWGDMTVYIKHLCLTHHASLVYRPSPVEIWMPDMESTAARAPIAHQSHPSQMQEHTDAAVFAVINRKRKHEPLAGRPLKSLASKSSAPAFVLLLFWEEDVSVKLATSYSAGGDLRQGSGV